jgi:hypothetical protein
MHAKKGEPIEEAIRKCSVVPSNFYVINQLENIFDEDQEEIDLEFEYRSG